jgi:hypothetical protein
VRHIPRQALARYQRLKVSRREHARRVSPRPLAWALVCACAVSTNLYAHSVEAEEADRAAEGEIKRAITDYYLTMEFSGAEELLLDVVKECEGECQSETIARAWMYVGVVRGSGREEQGPARQAFEAALATDASVVLDEALATPGTRASYEAARDALVRKGKKTIPPLGSPTETGSVKLCPPDFPGCKDTTAEPPRKVEKLAAPDYPTNWLGIHFAADIGFIQGANVCATSNEDFECFAAGGDTAYPAALPAALDGKPGELGDPYPGTGIRSGASGGTLRALVSFEHAFSNRFSAAARLGYAFGGGPAGIGGRSFLPVHVEGRAQYWLRGLSAKGVQPYLHVGGGLAQVDIEKTGVTVRDCSQLPTRREFLDCINAENAYDSGNDPELPRQSLDSYRKLGKGFATAGGGVTVPLVGHANLQINLNAMLMLPSVGFVLEPSIGLQYEL